MRQARGKGSDVNSSGAAGAVRFTSVRGRWIIVATVLGSAMTMIDSTVVGIALPTIGRQFDTTVATLQWVVTGYMLTLSALLLLGGSLGDRYGRRLLFEVGTIWFTIASGLSALAPGATALIVLRVLQGVGAALLTPGSLAIVQAAFVREDRGRAIGAWAGLGGVASAVGPLLGGYLVMVASWRWIFLINLPLGLVVLLISARHLPESREAGPGQRIDVPGAVLAVLALAGVTYGLIEGPSGGWPTGAVVALAGGFVAAAAFLLVERRSTHPMLPLSLFKVRQFTTTNAVTFVVYAGLGGALFLLPVNLQVVGHYTPLQSGLALLPLTVIMLFLSAPSGRLAGRIGPRLQMSAGPVIVGLGLVLLSRAGSDTSYVSGVLPAVIVFGLGLAATVAPLTATALNSVSEDHSGLASAVNNVVARVGSLIAVAILPGIAGISGSAFLDPAALGNGFRTASIVAGTWCIAGGVLAAVGIRNPEREAGPPAAVEAAPFHCALDATQLEARA